VEFVLFGIVGFFLLWAAFIGWTYFGVRREARVVYNAARDRREFPSDEPYPPFERAYLKTSILRVSIYRWVASVTAVIALPLLVWILNSLWVRAYYAFGVDAVFEEGTLIHSFFLAVGCIAGLVFIAGFFARAYHKNRPFDFDLAWEEEKRKSDSGVSPAAVANEEQKTQ